MLLVVRLFWHNACKHVWFQLKRQNVMSHSNASTIPSHTIQNEKKSKRFVKVENAQNWLNLLRKKLYCI